MGGSGQIFEVLGEPAAAAEPGEGAFDNPTLGQYSKALRLIGALNDLYLEPRPNFGQRFFELRSLITAIGEELFEKREEAKQRR